MIPVKKYSTAMVALQRLKAHWLKMHQSQAAGEFCYNTLYDTERIVADTAPVSVVDINGLIQDPAPEMIQDPAAAILDPVAREEYPDTVYQCPGMEKQKQCPEKSMDVNSLRIHWGSRHNVDGRPFTPLQMSVNELEHFACCADNCTYRYVL